MKNKGQANPSPIGNVEQAEFLVLEHIKRKLSEANKCLYALRSLRKEGYNQVEIDHLFQSFVLPKISYGLRVYAASVPELNTAQQFLRRCHKRRFISYAIDIYHLLEKTDRSISKKISCGPTHPLYNLLPRVKESSKRLRTQTSLIPCVNTDLLKLVLLIECILNILLLFN